MASLALRGVRKEYGKVIALQGLDLEVGDGEFFVLLGPSGAGKTTTLKCVAGLEAPTIGHVEINGRDMSDVEPNGRHVAMAFENYALYPQHSVFDNIAFPLRSPRYRIPPTEARARIERVAGTLGISHLLERAPRELSGGQRQRVALARVLVRPADVLLLDEPLSHLDAKLRAAMRAELKSLGELQRTTSLYVTHDYLEALALGDRIAVLRQGHLVQVGTRQELWNTPVDAFVARAFGQPEINLLAGTVERGPDGPSFRATDGVLVVPLLGIDAPVGTAVDLGIRPRDVAIASDATSDLGSVALRGRVYVVEPLGRQLEVTVDIGECRISLITEEAGIEIDTMVPLQIPPSKLLLFERPSGRRLAAGHPAPVSTREVTAHA